MRGKKYKKYIIIFIIAFFWNIQVLTANNINNLVYSFHHQTFIAYNDFIIALKDFDIIILGENHDNEIHHDNQKNIMNEFYNYGPINVGLEFISWMYQSKLDDFLNNVIDEETFLTLIGWGGFPFSFYRPLISIAHESGGHAFGINAPSFLTRKISRQGLESLTPNELELLPPNFELGSQLYFERFKEIFSQIDHPMPDTAIRKFFEAQSTWDDSMAYHTIKNYHEKQVPFFVIVGNFHVQYKLGLPARIFARENYLNVASVVQIDATKLSEFEILEILAPHPFYGEIGDFVIFTKPPRF